MGVNCVYSTLIHYIVFFMHKGMFGSGVLKPGAVFLRFVTEAILLFLALAGALTLRGNH